MVEVCLAGDTVGEFSFSRVSYLNSLGEMRKFFVWEIRQQYLARRKLTNLLLRRARQT